jgi:hypothetical protein
VPFSALEAALDEDLQVSENVAEDIVEYSRGNVVSNEEQLLLTVLQTTTGWMRQDERNVNLGLVGPPAGGKTLVQDAAADLFPDDDCYETTDASSNALIDDPMWDYSIVAILDEYDKIDANIREYMKSMAGEDGGYEKMRNVENQDARGGYAPERVSSRSMPFQFLYAPVSKKQGLDHELKSRMLMLHVDDNRAIREAIGRKEAGHERIEVTGLPNTYIFETSNIESALRRHIRELPVEELWDETPDEQEVPVRVGSSHAEMPPWVWYSVRPIFDEGPTQTNRTFGMVFNLIRASALLNHHERPNVTKSVDGEERPAYLVQPQDVANVLSCQPALLSTTHNLDPTKRDVLDGLRSSMREDGTTTRQRIKDWMEDNDLNPPRKQQLGEILEELEQMYFCHIRERAGEDGSTHLYEWRDEGNVETARLHDLQRYADKDDVDLSECRIDPADPYEGCRDPIRDQPFKESIADFEAEFSESETAVNAASFMSGGDTSDGSDSADDDTQQTLTGESDDADDGLPEPERGPENALEQAVYRAIEDGIEANGSDGWRVFPERASAAHYVGAVDPDYDVGEVDTSDTLLDPDHEVYGDAMFAEGRVRTEEDCKREVSDTVDELDRVGLLAVQSADIAGFVEITTVPWGR